jgi:hypothetical protein
MNKKDLTYLTIDSVGEVVTNYDTKDIPDKYALDAKGVKLGKEGMVIERCLGTRRIYDSLPTVPTGSQTLAGGYRFYNKDTNLEYDIELTVDATTNYARIYINDSTLASANVGSTNNWIDLTRVFTAKVASTGESTLAVSSVTDSLGTIYRDGTFQNDEVNYWICYNTKRSNAVLITNGTGNTLTVPNNTTTISWAANDNLVFFRTNWLFNNFHKVDESVWSGAEINLDLGATPHNRWLPIESQKKVNLALGSSANPPIMRNLQRIQVNAAKPLFYNADTTSYLLTFPANWDAQTIGGLNTYFLAKGSAGTPITTTLTDETVNVTTDTNADGIAGSAFMQILYSLSHTVTTGSKEVHLRTAVTLEYDGYQESDPIYRGYYQCPADYLPSMWLKSIAINPATMPRNLTAINFYMASHNNDLTGAQWADSDTDYKLVFSFPINTTQYNAWGTLTDYDTSLDWNLDATSLYCYKLTCEARIMINAGVSFSVGEIAGLVGVGGTATGSGYSVGNVLTLVESGSSGSATATVVSVNITGGVNTVSLTTSGTSGFTTGIKATTVAPAGGTGCTIMVTKLASKYNTTTNGTLASRLTHATDTIRTLVKPRFMVKSARNQAAIQVMDKDEATLRLSCYDGAGSHEDDNYPDVTADSNGNKQLIALNGKGIMGGLAISRDVITVFRSTEAETFDLQSGAQSIFDIDFLAKDSLVRSPYGLTWAGRTGLWFMPENGSSIRQINLTWANKYNGSMMIDNGTTPYITDAYRSAIISGYDPYTKAAVFSYQQNKHDTGSEYVIASYEFDYDRWSFRVLGGSAVAKYFLQKTRVGATDAAKLLIGTTSYLLQYPNLTGSFPYTDSETTIGEAGSGFETDITINVKNLYNQVQNANLNCFLIDQIGSSITGTGNFIVEFYANDETTAFDTQYVPIDKPGEFRNIDARGNLDSLRIRMYLPSTSLADFKKWNVSRIILGFNKKARVGNL